MHQMHVMVTGNSVPLQALRKHQKVRQWTRLLADIDSGSANGTGNMPVLIGRDLQSLSHGRSIIRAPSTTLGDLDFFQTGQGSGLQSHVMALYLHFHRTPSIDRGMHITAVQG